VLDKLVDAIIEFLDLFRFWEVVRQYEVGVRLRLGKYWDTLEPGRLYFRAPFGIDEIMTDYATPTARQLEQQVITLRDGVTIVVTPIITYQPHDPYKYFLEVETPESAIGDCARGTIREILSAMTYDEAQSPAVTETVTAAVRKMGYKWGIKVITVAMADLAKVRAYRIYGGQ